MPDREILSPHWGHVLPIQVIAIKAMYIYYLVVLSGQELLLNKKSTRWHLYGHLTNYTQRHGKSLGINRSV